jgi:alcohol dehydrogenase (cytochrome c)
MKKIVFTISVFLIHVLAAAQELDPSLLMKPLSNSWPTYSGDYSGKRYSSLTQINRSNVKNLTLAWTLRVTGGTSADGGGRRGGSGGASAPTIVGGEGTGDGSLGASGGPRVSGAILQVKGILYFSAPDNAWAVDAIDGHEIWHYFWKTKGGTHIGNRGLGMWGDLALPGDA